MFVSLQGEVPTTLDECLRLFSTRSSFRLFIFAISSLSTRSLAISLCGNQQTPASSQGFSDFSSLPPFIPRSAGRFPFPPTTLVIPDPASRLLVSSPLFKAWLPGLQTTAALQRCFPLTIAELSSFPFFFLFQTKALFSPNKHPSFAPSENGEPGAPLIRRLREVNAPPAFV